MPSTSNGKGAKADIKVQSLGTITMVYPLTAAGAVWMANNVEAEAWQYHNHGLAAEPRTIPPIVDGAREAGLIVVEESA